MTQQFSSEIMSQIFTYTEFLQSKYIVQVCDLWHDCFPDMFSIEDGDGLREIFEKSGITKNTLIQVIPTPGKRKVVAVACYFLADPKILKGKEAFVTALRDKGMTGDGDVYMYNVCVRKRDRRKGKGMILMKDIEEYLTKLEKKKLVLFVEGKNEAASRLYSKVGYNVRRATPTGFLMEKNLP